MRYFSFPQAVCLSVSGPHAERYLQVRLTNDLKQVSPAKACLAAALSPQGKTEALFTVLALEQAKYLLFSEAGNAEQILIALKRFIVTERLDIACVSSEFSVFHLLFDSGSENLQSVLPSQPEIDKEFSVISGGGIYSMVRRRSSSNGVDLLIPKSQENKVRDELKLQGREISENEQLLLRIQANVPLFPWELNSEHLLPEAGNGFAVSFSKGCYTGQEVIAKIDALGKPPRILARFQAPGAPPQKGAAVLASSESRPVGEVLSAAFDEKSGQSWCFASIRNNFDLAQAQFVIGERAATLVAS